MKNYDDVNNSEDVWEDGDGFETVGKIFTICVYSALFVVVAVIGLAFYSWLK